MPLYGQNPNELVATPEMVAAVAAAAAEADKKDKPTWSTMDTEFTLPSPEELELRQDLKNRRFQVEYQGKFYFQEYGGWSPKEKIKANTMAWHPFAWVIRCKGNAYIVHVLRDGPPEPLPDGKKCLIANMVPAHTLKLLKKAPQNEAIRALVMARIKRAIPDEVKKFDDIVEWIEGNIDQAALSLEPIKKSGPAPDFYCDVRYSYREYGRCNYSQRMRNRVDYSMSSNMILEAIGGAANFEGAVRAVSSNLQSQCNEDPPEDCESYNQDHFNYETEGEEQHEANPQNVGPRLAEYLYEHMNGEYQRLFGHNEPPEEQ